MTRSIYLPGESGSDLESDLAQTETDEERKHLMSERLKINGWTKEKEEKFREHCATVGFVLPSQTTKTKPMARNPQTGSKARLHLDAIKHGFRQTKTLNGDVEE